MPLPKNIPLLFTLVGVACLTNFPNLLQFMASSLCGTVETTFDIYKMPVKQMTAIY